MRGSVETLKINKLLLISLLVILLLPVVYADWWDAAWNQRQLVTIPGTIEELTNFTVALNVSINSRMQSDLDDIRFINGECSGIQTEVLSYEFDINTTSNAGIFWVRIPTLSMGNDNICMYFNNTAATIGENVTDTWDKFLHVLHLNNDTTRTTGFNAVNPLLNWTIAIGGNLTLNESACIFGQCATSGINRTANYLNFSGSIMNINFNPNATMFLLFQTNSSSNIVGTQPYPMGCGRAGNDDCNLLINSTSVVQALVNGQSLSGDSIFDSNPANRWLFWAFRWNGTTQNNYWINNEINMTRNEAGTLPLSTIEENLFGNPRLRNGANADYANAITIDEFFVYNSSLPLTNAWIARFLINTNFSLVSFGAEQNFTQLDVTLESPINGTASTNVNQTFICSVNSNLVNINITNVTYTLYDSSATLEASTFRNLVSDNSRTANESFTVNSLASDVYQWNCEYHTNNTQQSQSTNNSLTIDSIFPSIVITEPNGIFINTSIDINVTINDTNLNTCKYTIDGGLTNTTLVDCANTTFLSAPGFFTFTLYANDTVGQESSNTTSYVGLGEPFLTFLNQSLEVDNQNFSLTIVNGSAKIIESLFVYNGTTQGDIVTRSNGTSISINATITTSNENSSARFSNNSLQFNVTFQYLGENATVVTDLANQTLYQRYLDDCQQGVTTQLSANYTIQDEETNETLAGTYSHLYSTLSSTQNIIRTFNFTDTNAGSSAVCIFPVWGNFTVNTRVAYSFNDSYNGREFVVGADRFDNFTRDIILRLLNTGAATDVTAIVRDQNDNNLEGYTIEVFKFNIVTNAFDFIDSGITDFAGRTLFQLDNSQTYRFIISLNGVEALRKDNIQIIGLAPELFFIVTLGEKEPITSTLEAFNFTYNLVFNQSGGHNLSLAFTDLGGTASSVCLVVENITLGNNQEIFNQCSTADFAQLNFTMLLLNESYMGRAYMVSNFDNSVNQLGQIFIDLRAKIKLKFFGGDDSNNDRIFYSLMIIMLLAGIGASTGNPVITIVLTLIGVVAAWMIGFMPITIAGLMGIIVVGGFIIFMMKT